MLPYSHMMQKIGANWQQMMKNGSNAKLVAQVVLEANQVKGATTPVPGRQGYGSLD